MRLNFWTEIRTAWCVAELRNITRAAKQLGMHHSSVIRHIDALETELGVKLFQRHSRGYTPTEAGEELLRTASSVDEQLLNLRARIEHSQVQISGRLVLTSVPSLDFTIMPMIARYQRQYPQVEVVYVADPRNFELSLGEAHVALRAGPRSTTPDDIVTPAWDFFPGLYASPAYAERFGLPRNVNELVHHRFIVGNEPAPLAPFTKWLHARLPQSALVLRTSQMSAQYAAIQSGVGIGFLSTRVAPPGMVPVLPDLTPPEWKVQIWMVTHVDLHRSPKVQSLTRFIQQEVKSGRIK
ncbi:LysR family transcriptional regulator [Paracoccus sp. S1E-3]|nr:LysR family transcriptional regulator [Paracoccus sp. S1E-3]